MPQMHLKITPYKSNKMKRREALKNLGLASAFFVASPAIISLLQSCKSEVAIWKPVFFTEPQGKVLVRLVDIILPKTSIPAASALNVPQFIDTYLNETTSPEEQAKIKNGFDALIKHIGKEDVSKITDEEYKALLDTYMLVKGEKDSERIANPTSKEITKAELLGELKWMTINAYKTTAYIGKEVLAYDPVPGAYYCGDLQELTGGKSWSL